MAETKPRVKLTFIALLTPFRLVYNDPSGFGIDFQLAKCMPAHFEELKNIDINKGLELAPNVLLRLSTKEDAEQLKPFSEPIGNPVRANAYVLESSIESEDSLLPFSGVWELIDSRIDCAINALRLLKTGYVEANNRIITTMRGSKKEGSLYKSSSIPRDNFGQGIVYELGTKDLIQLKDLTERTSKIDFSRRGALRIAFDRFERSYYEPYLEDQLIDYMIAFEALFVGKRIREQSAVVPVAAGMLLGRDEDDRADICKTLELAYEIRNCIVHGSDYDQKLEAQKIQMPLLTTKLENILRESIKKLM